MKIIYNIKIVTSFKGLIPTFKTGTLEVSKTNNKHKIQLNKPFLYMGSAISKDTNIVLTSGCYNKLFSLLSIQEIAFLGKKPDQYCDKCDCKLQKCLKKCGQYCELHCDDEQSCKEDCEIQCKYIHWYYLHKSQLKKSRAIDEF